VVAFNGKALLQYYVWLLQIPEWLLQVPEWLLQMPEWLLQIPLELCVFVVTCRWTQQQ
jgi:hypothetical protein